MTIEAFSQPVPNVRNEHTLMDALREHRRNRVNSGDHILIVPQLLPEAQLAAQGILGLIVPDMPDLPNFHDDQN